MAQPSHSSAQDTAHHPPVPVIRNHRGVLAAAASLGVYLIGALYLLARVLPTFTQAIPGIGIASIDGWQNTWNLWWTHVALARGHTPYVTDMVFFPTGQSLYLHTLNITNALITMPVQLIAGPIAAYNMALILGVTLTGFTTYLLALYLIGDRRIACAVGAIFTFGPFHVAKLADGHLSWVTVFWIPLYLLFTVRALDTGTWRWRMLAGVVLAGATLTSYYYLLFSGIFTALLLVARLPSAVRARRWHTELSSGLVIGCLGVLLAAPLLLPAIRDFLRNRQVVVDVAADTRAADGAVWDRETFTYSADVVDILFPNPLHPWWGTWANQHHATMRYGWFWTIAPGYSVLLLALVGSLAAWRRVRVWVVLVGVLWLLMLGPELRVAGKETGIPMPFDLLQVLPGMTLGHRPNHFAIFMLPLLAILAGFGMQVLSRRGRAGRTALALLGALVVLESMVLPVPALPFAADPVLEQLRDQPGAVMDLPNVQRHIEAMKHQMVHGQPIVGGYLARPPVSTPFTDTIPWIRQLWWLTPEDGADILVPRPDDGKQALNFYNVRTIIVRREEMDDADATHFQQIMAQVLPRSKPAYRGPTLDVYRVEPVAMPRPFVFLGSDWHDLERNGEVSWRWMADEATVQIVNPATTARQVTLEASLHSYQQPRPLEVALDGHPVAAYQIPLEHQTARLPLTLSPGAHTLTFTSVPATEPAPASRQLSLMFTHIALAVQ